MRYHKQEGINQLNQGHPVKNSAFLQHSMQSKNSRFCI